MPWIFSCLEASPWTPSWHETLSGNKKGHNWSKCTRKSTIFFSHDLPTFPHSLRSASLCTCMQGLSFTPIFLSSHSSYSYKTSMEETSQTLCANNISSRKEEFGIRWVSCKRNASRERKQSLFEEYYRHEQHSLILHERRWIREKEPLDSHAIMDCVSVLMSMSKWTKETSFPLFILVLFSVVHDFVFSQNSSSRRWTTMPRKSIFYPQENRHFSSLSTSFVGRRKSMRGSDLQNNVSITCITYTEMSKCREWVNASIPDILSCFARNIEASVMQMIPSIKMSLSKLSSSNAWYAKRKLSVSLELFCHTVSHILCSLEYQQDMKHQSHTRSESTKRCLWPSERRQGSTQRRKWIQALEIHVNHANKRKKRQVIKRPNVLFLSVCLILWGTQKGLSLLFIPKR